MPGASRYGGLMSTFYLVNSVRLGTKRLSPGALINDDYDDVNGIRAAGGLLVTSSDQTIAAAALIAAQLVLHGSFNDALGVMLAAATKSTAGNVVEDPGNFTDETTLAGQIQELYQDRISGLGVIQLPPRAFWLATGAPLAVFADGASAVPGSFADSKGVGVRWNNHGTPNGIASSFSTPTDADIAFNATLHVRACKIGATAGDLPTFAVELYNQVDGALYDADANFGGTTSAMTNAATKTVQNVTLSVTAENLAAYPATTSIIIKPTAGTLGTDDLVFFGAYLLYKTKLRTQ